MKSEEQLTDKCDEIIDSLKDFNIAEKYRVIKALWESLQDAIKLENIEIKELEEKELKK